MSHSDSFAPSEINTESKSAGMVFVWILLGPVIAVAVYFLLQSATNLSQPASAAAAVTAWMALWWITECIPLAVTSLLPIILFPLTGVYSDPLVVGASVAISGDVIAKPDTTQVMKVKSHDGDKLIVGSDLNAKQTYQVAVSEVAPLDRRSAIVRTTAVYADQFIFLFLGGFLIARGIERWLLHKRIALHVLLLMGTSPSRLVLGFMMATALISMWISNTATTVMMLPVAISVLQQLREGQLETDGASLRNFSNFACSLMLSIAYAASIGGISTLIGTPPNALLARQMSAIDSPISFVDWMLFATPLAFITLLLTWLLLTKILFPTQLTEREGTKTILQKQLADLGRMKREEVLALSIFVCVALAWIVRGVLAEIPSVASHLPWLKTLNDPMIAMFGGILIFILPASFNPPKFLLTWEFAERIPWGVLLLFGGGLAIADGFEGSGLSHSIATLFSSAKEVHPWVLVILITTVVIFLTEVTSNMATAALFLPVLVSLAESVNQGSEGTFSAGLLTIPATLACSFAFMLPVATPPNAIVFASGHLTVRQMASAGLWLNLLGIPLITLWLWLFGWILL